MKYYFENDGYCVCCDKNLKFIATNSWYRDNYICSNCKSIPRERALMYLIEKFYPNYNLLDIHESSPCKRGASLKLQNKCPNYIASQYYGESDKGKIINGYRNENLESQTFKDESFDLVITQDVMEHIFNPQSAFREIARTLKPGGAHIFTVPLINKERTTECWAKLDDNNNIIFLKEKEYHGNPINPKGSPVTFHYGYDIVDLIYKSSGMVTQIFTIDNVDLGIRAEYIDVLISRKI